MSEKLLFEAIHGSPLSLLERRLLWAGPLRVHAKRQWSTCYCMLLNDCIMWLRRESATSVKHESSASSASGTQSTPPLAYVGHMTLDTLRVDEYPSEVPVEIDSTTNAEPLDEAVFACVSEPFAAAATTLTAAPTTPGVVFFQAPSFSSFFEWIFAVTAALPRTGGGGGASLQSATRGLPVPRSIADRQRLSQRVCRRLRNAEVGFVNEIERTLQVFCLDLSRASIVDPLESADIFGAVDEIAEATVRSAGASSLSFVHTAIYDNNSLVVACRAYLFRVRSQFGQQVVLINAATVAGEPYDEADMQRVVVECREIFAGLLAINVDTSTSTTTPLDAYERYAATLQQRMQRLRRLFAPTSALRARLTQFVGQHLEHGDRDERIDE